MKQIISLYQVDAFTNEIFKGNPAAVCPIEEWLPDRTMQLIASENNLSETAFVNLNTSPFSIRWFSPISEVDLCGHATLASARILFDEYLYIEESQITFGSKSGELRAFKKDELIYLDFPVDNPKQVEEHPLILKALGIKPKYLFKGRDDFLAIFENEEIIQSIYPNFNVVSELDSRGLIISSVSSNEDFISRCFYPKLGVEEDPVTGSAHTLLTPYWAKVLNKSKLSARQYSLRGGHLECQLKGNRVLLGGGSVRYMEGKIDLRSFLNNKL